MQSSWNVQQHPNAQNYQGNHSTPAGNYGGGGAAQQTNPAGNCYGASSYASGVGSSGSSVQPYALAAPVGYGHNTTTHTTIINGHPYPRTSQDVVDPAKLAQALSVGPDDDEWGGYQHFQFSDDAARVRMLSQLNAGNWPVGLVIGARAKFSFESLGKAFHESGNISMVDLGRASQQHLSFSSIEGHSLRDPSDGLISRAARSHQRKLYFAMSRWGTVYVVEEKNTATRDERKRLRDWVDSVVEVDSKSYVRMPTTDGYLRNTNINPLIAEKPWTTLGAANTGQWSFRLVLPIQSTNAYAPQPPVQQYGTTPQQQNLAVAYPAYGAQLPHSGQWNYPQGPSY